MHKINGAGATDDAQFTEGDPAKRIPATTLTAAWLNTIQNEIANAVGNDNLDESNDTQLKSVLDILANNIENVLNRLKQLDLVGKLNIRSCNIGILNKIAQNEIHANGQLLQRNEYAQLWEYALKSGRLVAEADWHKTADAKLQFSDGDGSTTFRLAQLKPADLVK